MRAVSQNPINATNGPDRERRNERNTTAACVLAISIRPIVQNIPIRIMGQRRRVSLATIHRAESVDGITVMTLANATAIRRALENAGVD
jgi:hypothetical protein